MREIEFVPPWYTATHRKRRLLKLQLYCTIVVALSLATWTITQAQSVDRGNTVLEQRRQELEASSYRVRERQEQDRLRAQYQLQRRVGASLGLNVESSRLIRLLEQSMPREASLLDITIDTTERNVPLSQRASASKVGKPQPEVERQMNVKFKGVAPTHGDIATLLDNLRKTELVSDLLLDYARDRTDGEYLMHEFSVRFSIRLDAEGGAR
jgi:hypothetical protein